VEIDAQYLTAHDVYRDSGFLREPYLSSVGHDTAHIRCRTYRAKPPELALAPAPKGVKLRWATRTVALNKQEQDRLRAAKRYVANEVFEHTATLSGLTARSRFRGVLTAKHGTRDVTLRTLPKPGTRLADGDRISILVLGDTGTGSEAQWQVARAIDRSLDKPNGIAADLDAVVHLGDAVYDDGAAEDVDAVLFAPYRNLLARAPLYLAIGNHDTRIRNGDELRQALATPEGTEGWHRLLLGPLELILVDSANKKPSATLYRATSEQSSWLELVSRDPLAPWRVVALHHAPLSSGTRHGSGRFSAERGMRENMAALRPVVGEVDLVLAGHDHHFERSVPIQPAWVDPSGAVEVPEGREGSGKAVARGPIAVGVERAVLDPGDTVFMVQGTGGGNLADTVGTRVAWATLWTLGLPLATPLWMSYWPSGFDAVDPGEAWVERAGLGYGFTRLDVDGKTCRARTFMVDVEDGSIQKVDDVIYQHRAPGHRGARAFGARAGAGTTP
jgi:hypothetical protein